MITRTAKRCVRQYSTATSFLQSVEYQTRLHKLRFALQEDGRSQIPVPQFLELLQKQIGVSEENAKLMLAKFHETGVFLHFPDHPLLSGNVLVKPELLVQQLISVADAEKLQPAMEARVSHLASLHAQLEPLLKEKLNLDAKGARRVKTFFVGGIFYLLLQMGAYAKWIWIDYGWDVVEPMTYFTSFTVVLGSYIYFNSAKAEYQYPDLWSRWIATSVAKQYKKNGFDIAKFDRLSKCIGEATKKLESDCETFYGCKGIPQHIANALEQQKSRLLLEQEKQTSKQ